MCDMNESFGGTSSWLHDPIVIGYAFGPKKMTTMGAVMAEASKARILAPIVEDPPLSLQGQQQQQQQQHDEDEDEDTWYNMNDHEDTFFNATTSSSPILTLEALHKLKDDDDNDNDNSYNNENNDDNKNDHTDSCNYSLTKQSKRADKPRLSQSSSSSLASTSSMDTTAASTVTTTVNTHKWIRLSFVPLDPNAPLNQQHDHKLDLILHKLTEDILFCSLNQDNHHLLKSSPPYHRVQQLIHYKHEHNPQCCLVDDPRKIQTLMSRADIAQVLKACLHGVTSTTGIPVSTPRFFVLPKQKVPYTDIDEMVNSAGISYPIICKPLVAAGTKESHYMAIVLNPQGLQATIKQNHSSIIVQNYVNHNALLYKVYVLGDFVSVYQRPSLPNLPHSDLFFIDDNPLVVEFDSQRPYPQLQEFGIRNQNTNISPPTKPSIANNNCRNCIMHQAVTSQEVRPIVTALKRAFGLQLFGFDIILTDDGDDHNQIKKPQYMVVDVNYFPSYKEVPDFPSLMAQYLTNQVLESRRQAAHQQR